MSDALVECVPNFSEGKNSEVIKEISKIIDEIEGVTLLDVDSSEDFNRTVISFVGSPTNVLDAAKKCSKRGLDLIDMTEHKGEHARMGAVDVVPFIPISNCDMDDCISLAEKFGKYLGEELMIPVYLYANAAKVPERRLLPNIRKGEYEGFKDKIKLKEWKPDFGPQKFVPKSGVTASGARSVLIAFNINLSTDDKSLANSIAGKIRTSGIIKKDENGEKILNSEGKAERIPGKFSNLQAAGWMYDSTTAQVSMNLLNFSETGMHHVMEEIKKEAAKLNLNVTAGELVGLVPLNAILDSGKYYHSNPSGASIEDLVEAAIEGLMLNKLSEFQSNKRIIEWAAK